jgi:hypothetical protein
MSYTASCGNAVYTAVQTTTQTVMSAVTPASSTGNGGNGGNGANGANGGNGAGNGNASAGNGGASGPATATTTQSPSSSQSSGGASSDTGAAVAPSQFTGAAVVGKSRSMNGAFVGLLAGALLILDVLMGLIGGVWDLGVKLPIAAMVANSSGWDWERVPIFHGGVGVCAGLDSEGRGRLPYCTV